MDQVYLKKNWQKATNALEKSDYKSAISLLSKIQKKIPPESGAEVWTRKADEILSLAF